MSSKPKPPVRVRTARRNTVALDGTLDKIGSLRIAIAEKGKYADSTEIRIQHRDAVREWIDCRNETCYEGGFSLGQLLREMTDSQQYEYIGTSFCVGHEGDPDVPSTWTSCGTRFDSQIRLVFR